MRLIPTFELRPRWRRCGWCGDPLELIDDTFRLIEILPEPTVHAMFVVARISRPMRCLGCGRRTQIESDEIVEIEDVPITFHRARPETLYISREEVGS